MIEGFGSLNLTSQDFVMSQLNTDDLPQSITQLPKIHKLDHLVIKNFKSFKEQTYTGPFLGFTSIIGPNGSGKSNVLDALIFCLCGENLKQNFYDIREYINRQKSQSYKEMSKKKKVCSITATFILQNGQKLTLRRQLTPQGQQNFYINYQPIAKKIYENFLYKQGINPHIPNYAITQGQIDKLLMRQPLQLSKFIQNLSGSYLYKKQYDNLRQQIQQMKNNIIRATQTLMRLKNQKKNARSLNAASRQYNELEKQYNQLVNRIFLAKIWIKQQSLIEYEHMIEKKRQEENQRMQQINKRKLQMQEELKQKDNLYKQLGKLQKRIKELDGELKMLNRPQIMLNSNQISNVENELKYLQKQYQMLEEKRNTLVAINDGEEHSSEVVKQYLNIFTQYERKNRQVSIQLDNKKAQYYRLQSQKQLQQSLLISQKQKIKQTDMQNQKRMKDLEFTKKQLAQLQQTIRKHHEQSKLYEQRYKQFLIVKRQKVQQFEKVSNQIESIQNLLLEGVELEKDKQIVKKLSIINGFRGIIEQKIKPVQQKYVVAFGVLTASISKYLLCVDENSSKQISDKLKSMSLIKNLIILGNIKKSNMSNQSNKEQANKSYMNSLDIIDFEKNIQGLSQFLQDFCRGKLICDDLKTAFQLRNKKIPNVRQIITLNGEVIKNDGTICANGNVLNLKRLYKQHISKKSLQVELQKAIKTHDQLSKILSNLQKQYSQKFLQQKGQQAFKLQKKKQDLQQKIKFLSSKQSNSSSLSSNTIKQYQKDIMLIKDNMQKIQKQISEIQRSISKDQVISKFMKKHNITNLETFRSVSNIEKLEKERRKSMERELEINQLGSKLEELKNKMNSKNKTLSYLKNDLIKKFGGTDKVRNIGNTSEQMMFRNRKDVEKEKEECQNMMKQITRKISNLGVWKQTDLRQTTQVIQMQTKYKLLKQKFRQAAQQLRIQLGVKTNIPRSPQDYRPLKQFLSLQSVKQLTSRKVQTCIRDLQSQRKLTSSRLQKLNGMNVVQRDHQKQQAEINNQIKQLLNDVSKWEKSKDEYQKNIQVVKRQRKGLFMEFFETVKTNVKQCYRVLTEIEPNLYGKVDLYLEDSQIPFDNGVYFTPTPPNKRYIYDLEQLSGGEKSIASLALQYSLAISSRSPFLILDQSDTYLDSKNAAKLLKLLKQSSRQRNNKKIQIVLVTHKMNIFAQCESIVGVTRAPQQFSKVYSLRIKPDQHKEQQDGQQLNN